MEDRDWLILKELYEHKNITKTAQLLFISQPALTNRLRLIEKEFGVKIVQRGRRGVHFTPQGEYIAKSADHVLAEIRNIKENALNMGQKVSGTLRIAASNLFTRSILPRLLSEFKMQYPDVEFKVMTGWSRDMFNLIYNQDVHIGFIRGDFEWTDRKNLIYEETVCVANKEKIDLTELPFMSRIDYRTDYSFKMLIDSWWTENYAVPPNVGMEVDKQETCMEMVAHGLGYAILPSIILKNVDNIFRSTLIDKTNQPILRRTWMYYHEEALELNMVKAFVRFVEALDWQEYL